MTQEEANLLFKDICGRLKYEPYINYNNKIYGLYICYLEDLFNKVKKHKFSRGYDIRNLIIKPYLRPMSSMTDEEKKEFEDICTSTAKDRAHFVMEGSIDSNYMLEKFDWLNAHHFDYRGLLLKSLALEVPEDMYNTKTE
jgi:hypothetical protein